MVVVAVLYAVDKTLNCFARCRGKHFDLIPYLAVERQMCVFSNH